MSTYEQGHQGQQGQQPGAGFPGQWGAGPGQAHQQGQPMVAPGQVTPQGQWGQGQTWPMQGQADAGQYQGQRPMWSGQPVLGQPMPDQIPQAPQMPRGEVATQPSARQLKAEAKKAAKAEAKARKEAEKQAQKAEKEAQKQQAKEAKRADKAERIAWKRFLVIGAFLLALALFIGGFLSGWFAHDYLHRRDTSTQTSVGDGADLTSVAPDLRGTNITQAKQTLVDLGFDPNIVEIKETPWAGTPGTVVSQDPVGGEKLDQKLTLTVSTIATVPTLAGKTKSEAIQALQQLGAQTKIVEVFDGVTPAGTVISTTPAAGETLPSQITLTVSQAGSSIYLYDLKEADTTDQRLSCHKEQAGATGVNAGNALVCSLSKWSADKPSSASWLVSQKGSAFSATLAIKDTDSQSAQATVSVYADATLIGTYTLSYTSPVKLNIPITGVTRLSITAQPIGDQDADVALIEPLVKGTDADIADLKSRK